MARRLTTDNYMTRPLIYGMLLGAGLAAAWPTQAAMTVTTGVVYGVGAVNAHSTPATRSLLLDVYRPDPPTAAHGGALVLVHGGSFTSGSRATADMLDAAQYFTAVGWTCFSIDYRLVPDDPPAPPWVEVYTNPVFNAAHAAMVDTKRAVRWLRTHATDYGCALHRVAGLGHSAGAYCIIQACITDEDTFANDAGTATPDQWPASLGRLNAGIDVSGGVEVFTPEFSTGDPPLLIWHGQADTTVPYTEALEIQAACEAQAIPYRLFALPGVNHGTATWTALYDGQGLKEHAREFLDLLFALPVHPATTDGRAQLAWSALSNAVYEVRTTANLDLPFTNVLATVTARAATCVQELPEMPAPRFYRLDVRSVQPQP